MRVQLVSVPRDAKGNPVEEGVPLPEAWHIAVNDGGFVHGALMKLPYLCGADVKAPYSVTRSEYALPYGARPCSACVNTLLRAVEIFRG